VLRADHYYFPALARKEYFLPLDSLIEREKPGFLDDFTPLAVDEGRWNGVLYGMNVLFGAVMIYYNQDLFRKAGLPDPYDLYRRGKWDCGTGTPWSGPPGRSRAPRGRGRSSSESTW
jgi:multiple sugar transport system substrate-binding protein